MCRFRKDKFKIGGEPACSRAAARPIMKALAVAYFLVVLLLVSLLYAVTERAVNVLEEIDPQPML